MSLVWSMKFRSCSRYENVCCRSSWAPKAMSFCKHITIKTRKIKEWTTMRISQFFYWSRVVQAFAQLKRATSATKSGNTMFSKAVLKKRCTKAYLKSFLRKPLLKSYNYLQNGHHFPYYIGLYITDVKPLS